MITRARKIAILIILGSAVVIGLLGVGAWLLVWRHNSLWAQAEPPKGIRSIEDFLEWKGSEILGKGIYTDQSKRSDYQVYLAPSGRVLASGPSAYLFDEDGKFIEWTPDMGDSGTSIHNYDLSSGNLKRIK